MRWKGKETLLNLGAGDFRKGQGRKGKTEEVKRVGLWQRQPEFESVFFLCLNFL